MNLASSMRSWSHVVALGLLALAATEATAQSTNPKLDGRGRRYKVRIDSMPQRAMIYLDDKKYGPIGVTPWEGRLKKGPWRLILELDGYELGEREIFVRRTRQVQDTFVALVKRAEPALLDVRADADKNSTGADVWLDGQLQGQIPVILQVSEGRHLVEVKKEEFRDFSQWVEVKEGVRVTINPMLRASVKQRTGEIFVEADVADADVYIDGNKHPDRTPTVIRDVPEGFHIVEVRKDPAFWKHTVTVAPDRPVKVRAELKVQATSPGGSIRVLSNVDKAAVYLDGTQVGAVPLDLKDVDPGEHLLEVKATGYGPAEEKVVVQAGAALVKRFILRPAITAETGIVKIVSPVPEAVVYIDGQNIGQVPQTRDIAAGDHYIIVAKKGYKRFERKMRVEAGKTLSVTAELKAVGGVRFLSPANTPGAEILLDGEPIGQTPLIKEDVDVGEHSITMRYPGHFDYETTVQVEGGKLMVVKAKFEKIDTGPTPAELLREQRGLASFGARPLPGGRTTFDMAMGYPYYLDFRFNVGAGKLAGHGFDAGFFFRSFFSRSELGVTSRLNLATRDPFAIGLFGLVGGGSNFLDDSRRNSFFTDLGVLTSLTGLGSVTVTGRAYLNMWSDRHCPEIKGTTFDGTPIAVCRDWRNGNLAPTDEARVKELVGDAGPLERESGVRAMISVIVEVAVRQRWNVWALFEGAPFQRERAGYTDMFNGALFEEDVETYARTGVTYKF